MTTPKPALAEFDEKAANVAAREYSGRHGGSVGVLMDFEKQDAFLTGARWQHAQMAEQLKAAQAQEEADRSYIKFLIADVDKLQADLKTWQEMADWLQGVVLSVKQTSVEHSEKWNWCVEMLERYEDFKARMGEK